MIVDLKLKEYIDKYIQFYKLDGLLEYKRTAHKNIRYKKVLMYVLRDKLRLSYYEIGRLFNNDHVNVLYHCRSVEAAIKKDQDLERMVEDAWKLYRP